jgi:cation:H+ antiporter
MILGSIFLVGGLTVLYFGAEWFVSSASAIAVHLGITKLLLGLTVLAFGTSAPEVAVGVTASLAGQVRPMAILKSCPKNI